MTAISGAFFVPEPDHLHPIFTLCNNSNDVFARCRPLQASVTPTMGHNVDGAQTLGYEPNDIFNLA